ncbi:hydrolase, partial [Calderihabitans maritimus]
WRCIINACN